MGNWNSNEVEELKVFYKENNITSDQLVKDKIALEKFTSKFNSRISNGASFTSKEVADQLFKLRKSSKLPRIRN